ncbi:MAG: hypothetical protein PHC61_19005 [Chitinivibrionales bacterium]|nr:hypothetical protein [Chitinivibrionales bacterium]
MSEAAVNSALNPNPLVILWIACMGIALVLVPRKYVLFPLLMVAAYITLGQYVMVGPAHFTMLRFMVLFGVVRMVLRNDFTFSFHAVDKAVIYWVISSIVTYTILWQTPQALINRLGLCFDSFGIYFLFRAYLADFDDIARVVSFCALLMVPLAGSMIIEYTTGRNPFAVLNGVPLLSEVRNGHVRCQGSFRHPILMGTFGATQIPLIITLWWRNKMSRTIAIAGLLAAAIIVYCSGSSGAFMAGLYGIVGLGFWFLRDRMRMVRWALVVGLVIIQLIMKSPIWYLMARLSSVTGGTGWHRAYLIDQALRYLNEWWLVGTKVTAHWMPTGLLIDPTKADITNQYLAQGVNGGLLTMVLFILIIVRAFKAVGNATRDLAEGEFADRIVVWSMGAALFAHTVAFISVSYFDQISVFWFFLIAVMATAHKIAAAQKAMASIKPARTAAVPQSPWETVASGGSWS